VSFVSYNLSQVLTFLTIMGNFTIVNGQIYTPGLAIIDAPQPNTPLGGGKSTAPIMLGEISETNIDTQKTFRSRSMSRAMASSHGRRPRNPPTRQHSSTTLPCF
jgi:hypothetical protein